MMRRNGSTLVELTLSISAGSAVMLLAISLVHQTILVTEKSKHRTDHNRTLDQLAQCFRRDVHLAGEISPTEGSTMKLKCVDGSEIVYSVNDWVVVRERKNGPDGNEFERFTLDRFSTVDFHMDQSQQLASLSVHSETGTKETPSKPELVVESLVGRWKSLEGKSSVAQ